MAEEEGDTKYLSKLDDASKQKCRDELNERNPADTLIAVQTLRQWVKEQDWLRTPTDFEFLLRFLRFRKFSQLEARKALEKYWTVRSTRPEWFKNVDPEDPLLQKCMMQGVTTFSPVRDKHGRRLLIFQIGKMDIKLIKDIGLDIFYKMSCLFYDWLTLDENVQANGVVFIADYTGMTLQTFNLIADRSRQHDFMSYFQHALPVRTKSMNAYNEPAFFDIVYAFFSPFLSKKLKERFHIRGRSLVKIYEEVGYECLPEEYLPDDYEGPKAGTLKQMQDEMRRQVATPEFRRYVRELSSGKYGVDKNRIPAKSEAEGSYRKLNVD